MIVPQMIKDVGNDRIRIVAARGKIVRFFGFGMIAGDMIEKLGTHLAQKSVLGFKMSVKRAAAHVGKVDNILNSDVGVFFLHQKSIESAEYSFS